MEPGRELQVGLERDGLRVKRILNLDLDRLAPNAPKIKGPFGIQVASITVLQSSKDDSNIVVLTYDNGEWEALLPANPLAFVDEQVEAVRALLCQR